ncbi:MAG: MFS transporter [Candidatus Limnocylindrales bacterium]
MTDTRRQDWRFLLAIFWITSCVEGLGVSQIFAFVPTYLEGMGVHGSDRLHFVGLFGALIFVVGMPLVPLWGVWADKYSRKAVIVRSALVEAVVFACVALSREPWQLAASMLLVGFQLGNTGIMLGAIRDAVPRARIGTAMSLFGSSSPIGFAIGPVVGGIVVDRLGWGLPAVFALSAGLSAGTALLVAVLSQEVRPEVIPRGRSLDLAFGALRGVLGDHPTRRIFAIFFVAFLANQVTRPYIPILVSRVNGLLDETSAIGLVTGSAALVGALVAPIGGWLGDRIGYRPVLVVALLGAGVASLAMPLAPTVPLLALVAFGLAASYAMVAPMIFSLLGTEVSADRRSQTLNLVYLPLYLGGIVGPILAAVVVGFGLGAPFVLAAAVFLAGGARIVVLARRAAVGAPAAPEPPAAPVPPPAA